MKKLFSKLMLVTMAVLAFTSCEDVPEPYDKPGTGNNQPGSTTEIEGASGTGTLSDPFNAAAALNVGSKLASGEETATYYYIKGTVVSVKEEFTTQYGNGTFYISSDGTATNQFYAYRVNYLGNNRFADGDTQIKAGDEVIVCGKITNYNGTIETVQKAGFLYSLNGVSRGGEPDDEPQGGGTATGDGTLDSPFNSVAAIAYAKEVGDAESPKDVYIRGKVASITEQYGTQYGNATFTISDDGTATGAFTIYRALYLGNKKYTSGDLLKEGDEVIICGRVTNFRGNTPETVTGKAWLYSLNGKTGGSDTPDNPPIEGEAKGTGTLQDPYNSVAANEAASALASGAESATDVYIKGKVVSVKEQYGTQYGNATFYISDDGTEDGQFYVFRALYFGNEKYTSGPQLKKGDEVIVCGRLTNYMGNTPETVQNKAWLYSLNGSTEPGSDNPDTPDNPGGDVSGNSITADFTDMGFDNAQEVGTVTLSDGTKLTFEGGGNTNTPKYYNSGTAVRMYPKNFFTVTTGKKIASIVLTCSANNAEGQVTASPGSVAVSDMTVTISGINATTTTVTNAHTGTGAASQLRIKSLVVNYAE